LSELENLGQTDEQHHPPPRATTPGDLDHSHLGSMKLGSLVVTNGDPVSPGPSIAETFRSRPIGSHCHNHKEEEYFSAEESGPETPRAEKFTSRNTWSETEQEVFSGPLIQNAEAEGSTTATESPSTPRARRCGSRLKNQVRRDFSVTSSSQQSQQSDRTDGSEVTRYQLEDKTSIKQQSTKKLKTPRKRLSKAAPVRVSTTRLHDLVSEEFGFPDGDPILPSKFYHSRNDSSTSAPELACEYQAGLPDSPFSEVIPVPPRDALPMVADPSAEEGILDGNQQYYNSTKDTQASTVSLVSNLEPESAKETEEINPYAPWSSGVITPQTALGSHPPDRMHVPSHSTSLSSRPSQQSDSNYSTASHYRHEKSPQVETFDCNTGRFSPEDANNEERSWRELSPSEPNSHNIIRTGEKSMLPQSYNHNSTFSKSVSPRSSTVSSIIHDSAGTKAADRKEKAKSWRNSRMRFSRLLSSDSNSDRDKATISNHVAQTPDVRPQTAKSTKSATKSTTEARTPKKLQKKRPISYVPIPMIDLSIPIIPRELTIKLQDRPDIYGDCILGDRVVLGVPNEINERSKTPMMLLNDAVVEGNMVKISPSRPMLVKSASSPVGAPVKPSRAPPPLPRQDSAPARPTTQRRSSLTRLLRLNSMVGGNPKMLRSEEDYDSSLFPTEFASMGSVSHSLGASPYDFASSPPMQATRGHWQPPPKHSQHINSYMGQHMPIPRLKRPGFQMPRRPKSFHGRTVGNKMEMVGEETVEDIAYDDMMSASQNQQNSTDYSPFADDEQQHNQPLRPKSMGNSSVRQYIPHRSESEVYPVPPLPLKNKPSWSGPSDLWRAHRESAIQNIHSQKPVQLEVGLKTNALGSRISPIELPAISANPRPRSQIGQQQRHLLHQLHQPLRRPRPHSELISAKSQPELRASARFYTDHNASSNEVVGKAQRISQVPVGGPTVVVLRKKQPLAAT
jgi:hypothetical protein